MSERLRIRTFVDSRAPFDGSRYWRWEVYRLAEDDRDRIIFAMGWTATKREALRIARVVRQEMRR